MRAPARSKLYVEEHGEGDPLLLIEGLGQAMWAWREQIPVLARHFRTIAYDTRGTGRSPALDEPLGIADYAADAAAILDGRRAHVVALSMGGYVALTLALADPGLVRSLVLTGTGAGGPDRVPRHQYVRDAFAAALGLPPEEYGRRTMPYTFAPDWPEQHPERFEEILAARIERPTSYETIEAHANACYAYYDEGCEVERIEAPALVSNGDAELLGRGHNLPLEEPDTFNDLVLDFLR
jgi:3-oxoadipate enol-lactonase